MSQAYGISEAERDAINARIIELRRQDAIAVQELADSTHNGAETWHDNAAFDAAKDKKNLAQIGLGKLLTVLRRSKVIIHNSQPKKVGIGTTVSIHNETKDMMMTLRIAGDAAWLMGSEWASAQSPIGQAIMGAKIGDTRDVTIGNEVMTLKIVEIN